MGIYLHQIIQPPTPPPSSPPPFFLFFYLALLCRCSIPSIWTLGLCRRCAKLASFAVKVLQAASLLCSSWYHVAPTWRVSLLQAWTCACCFRTKLYTHTIVFEDSTRTKRELPQGWYCCYLTNIWTPAFLSSSFPAFRRHLLLIIAHSSPSVALFDFVLQVQFPRGLTYLTTQVARIISQPMLSFRAKTAFALNCLPSPRSPRYEAYVPCCHRTRLVDN